MIGGSQNPKNFFDVAQSPQKVYVPWHPSPRRRRGEHAPSIFRGHRHMRSVPAIASATEGAMQHQGFCASWDLNRYASRKLFPVSLYGFFGAVVIRDRIPSYDDAWRGFSQFFIYLVSKLRLAIRSLPPPPQPPRRRRHSSTSHRGYDLVVCDRMQADGRVHIVVFFRRGDRRRRRIFLRTHDVHRHPRLFRAEYRFFTVAIVGGKVYDSASRSSAC